ncbi:MAG: hypothetical protein WCO30_00210 [bacterium]
MDSKKLIWITMSIGLALGSLIPMLWGADMFSMSSTIMSAIGGFAGIYLGYKLS